jgi:hypothetical protein
MTEIIPIVIHAAELMFLLLFPVALWSTSAHMMHWMDTFAFFEVPGLSRLAFLSGFITGILLVLINHDPRFYDFEAVFNNGGPWDVSFIELFTVWLNPAHYSFEPLFYRIEALDLTDLVTLGALAAIAIAGAVVFMAYKYFRPNIPQAMFSSLMSWLWGVGVVLYAVCASAWLLHMLNFWAVILAFFVYRYKLIKKAAH